MIAVSNYPFVDQFVAIWGNDYKRAFILLMFPGLLANLHGLTYAYTRQMFVLSKAGLIPKLFSITDPNKRIPWR